MKTFCFLLSSSFLLLSCATDPGAAPLTSEGARQVPVEEAIYDVVWMQRYEGAARRGGARVYWVNKPLRERAE